MRLLSPSLPEIHAFVAAARLGSFLKAAEALCVTPGAISRAIARIESDLGCTLFSRHARGSVLTEQGHDYFAAVAPALDALEVAAAQARTLPEPSVLKLSVTPTLASHWLIRRLPDFQKRHPHITLAFVPYQASEFPLLAGQGASLRGGTGKWPSGLEADYVVGREIVPVCRPDALNPSGALKSPADLLHMPLLFHALHPDTWKNWFEAVGCPAQGLLPAASFDQVSQLLEAAASGMGAAVVQRCLIDDYLEAGRLVVACPQSADNDRGYYLCYPDVLRRSPALLALRSWLMEQGQQASARPAGGSGSTDLPAA